MIKNSPVVLPELCLIGLTCRTNLQSEMDPATAQIGTTLQKYFNKEIPKAIPHRKNPGITYSVYTDYESDFKGNYTYYVAEEVASFDEAPVGLSVLTIPAQTYLKFTFGPGTMPDLCIAAWQKIWSLSATELGGERSYLADFEVYDERAQDPKKTTFDIYIGIK